jgi:hypothetical protein
MNNLRKLGLAVLAAMALAAFLSAGNASATTLEVKGVKQTGAVTLKGSLETGTSAILKDELGSTTDTCTGGTVEGTTSTFTGANVSGPVSGFTITGCSHTTDVVSKGSVFVSWIKGTTNGTVSSANAEVSVRSTFFGVTATCKTGAGTDIGTITGKASGQATLDVNATLDCGALGNGFLTGSGVVTSPEGLGIVE